MSSTSSVTTATVKAVESKQVDESKESKGFVCDVLNSKYTTVLYNDGSKKDFARKTSVAEVMMSHPGLAKFESPVVAAYVNNLGTSLNRRIFHRNVKLSPMFLDSDDGMRTYRKSLVFALSLALHKIDPALTVVVRGAMGSSAYYCELEGESKIADMSGLLARMKTTLTDTVTRDLPISEHVLSFEDALKYFTAIHLPFAVKLLRSMNPSRVRCVECDGYMDIWRRPLVPRTGMLNVFDLERYESSSHNPNGFLIRFPVHGGNIKQVNPLPKMDVTMFESVYEEHQRVSRILNNYYVGQLNEVVENGKTQKDFISMSETLSNQKISDIAAKIHAKKTTRLVLIAGPSSSGKTTFAKKLMLQLRAYGKECQMISVDDYYKQRSECPKDKDGAYNFDCLEALRCDVLNDHLTRLFRGEKVDTPIFNFKTGMPEEKGRPRQLSSNGVLIMEGIFGLNPALTSKIPVEQKFRIFIAPLSQLNIDEHSYISNPQVRLLRLIVRDNQHRGWSATQSLARWPSVRRAERSEILQFFGEADAVMNSSLDYELCVMKVFALPLLHGVRVEDPVYTKARELISFLNEFYPIPHHNVPRDSLLREFIGESFFEY